MSSLELSHSIASEVGGAHDQGPILRQAPIPDLGTMVADGTQYVPELWWLPVFPGLAILIVVLGFNLLGDGLRDMLGVNL